MSLDGKQPLPSKRYYDLFSLIVTQATFSFCTAPFVLLNIGDSLVVWARVYFYCVVGVTACSLFLLTPGKSWLQQEIKKKNRPGFPWTESVDKQSTYLGLPNDPGKEWDEIVDEITAELDKRKREGLPIPSNLKELAREKLGKEL